eukprot:TRINITY_DN8111_c0_g1_i1.p1 TRINITY_DN8111_c0_g1~~TRINITY_DN8111_c0_g1_i1.p1  ORF type:complete len:550 (-),score=140.29 TRINITY_DN8111_c0_g1_i1:222-1871(-)
MPRLLLLCVLFLGAAAAAREALDRPNIIMFFVDDLGYGDLGFTGHPTTHTPTFDRLAYNGKILTSWYSGCPVCSGSRAALMTGRQFVRTGVPGVLSPTVNVGLPLNETTVAAQLKKAGYTTAAMGKWHLGQRSMFLPAARGFDRYLGIPYSDDMGEAKASACNKSTEQQESSRATEHMWHNYQQAGFTLEEDKPNSDPGGQYLPLVHQVNGSTTVLQQPLDFTTLADKYKAYATEFIQDNKEHPFFLYMPFSHVHTTAGNQPQKQFAGCAFKNSTRRGMFGDALSEADSIASAVVAKLEALKIEKNTLILFSSDNGPWMVQGKSGGSPGVHYGRSSGYWNVGKGSTWEGGVREPAFAYWPGTITGSTRSAEVVSSLDLFPTVSALANVAMPTDRVYDGKNMAQVLLDQGPSKHEFLWLYGSATSDGPQACRYGQYKAHWHTAPGLGGCDGCKKIDYDPPLLFNIEEDPSEAYPLTTNGKTPSDPELLAVLAALKQARAQEVSTMVYGKLVAPPDGPGEGPDKYGVCCDRAKGCDCDGAPSQSLWNDFEV